MMNKYQWITLIAAVVNLALVWVFPPLDYVSATRNNVPTFDGFHLRFSDIGPNMRINDTFLQLEYFVILLNAAIAWMLLKTRAAGKEGARKRTDWQRIVMIGVGINLLLALLFPPMENFYAVSKATLPSFDGFFFIFGDIGARTIVTQLLYLEVMFILGNGAMLWLLFRKTKDDVADAVLVAMSRQMKR
jgi:hypothetical protein